MVFQVQWHRAKGTKIRVKTLRFVFVLVACFKASQLTHWSQISPCTKGDKYLPCTLIGILYSDNDTHVWKQYINNQMILKYMIVYFLNL